MNELKPCPFCGGEAEVKHQKLNWFVICKYCFCRTPMNTTEFFARCNWNTRKPMDRIVEQLKEYQRNYSSGLDGFTDELVDRVLGNAVEIVKAGEQK